MKPNRYIEQISEYLYGYIEGESTDLSRNEYEQEARTLMGLIEKGEAERTPDGISEALRRIFDESFGEKYEAEMFAKAGDDIYELLEKDR